MFLYDASFWWVLNHLSACWKWTHVMLELSIERGKGHVKVYTLMHQSCSITCKLRPQGAP